ncbi:MULTISPECIES: DUF1542 domain-containing protein, partial [unclassified Lactobacillus]|uniref:DUF1542 domain-containing protein n=1 Tax=unclassified Lactobacillus TaxID=2620435 RepID=UPI002269D291
MKSKSNLIGETKNTNYKMHKSKKGWLVSYSLLTFMLGGIYLGSSNSTFQVNAASDTDKQEEQGKKGESEDLQKTVESKSLEDAKQNALTNIDAEATIIKEKINSDLNLTSTEKAQQVSNVDALVTAAKTKLNEAADLAGVKAIIEDTVSNIDNTYHPGSVISKAKSTVKKDTKKAPVVNKKLQPANNGKSIDNYKGLSVFFRSKASSNNAIATNDNSVAVTKSKSGNTESTSSLVAKSSENSATDSAKIVTENPASEKVENSSDNAAIDKKSINDVTIQDNDDFIAGKAADTDLGKSVTVANDPDNGRQDFNNSVGVAKETQTSVNIPVPDQVTNPTKYMQNAVNVSTFAELANAWVSSSVTYINITSDLANTDRTNIGNRPRGSANVIINGNGHTIDLTDQVFRLQNVTSSNPMTVTITNANFKQGFGVNDWDYDALVVVGAGAWDAGGLTVNIDNVNMSPSGNRNPIHVVVAGGAKVTFSGKNVFNISNEVTRNVGTIIFANNSSVEMYRTSNDRHFSEFYFASRIDKNSVGYGNKIIMGNGSTNIAKTYNNTYADFPAMYLFIDEFTAGDNVTWEQTGFQFFLNGTQLAKDDAKYTFGQGFTLKSPVTTSSGAIKLRARQTATFAAGASLDISQTDNSAVIQANDSSNIVFTSPRQLHLAIINRDGTAVNRTSSGVISGSGTVTLNNSKISTWLGGKSQGGKDPANNTAQFAQMYIKGGKAYLTPLGGDPSKDAQFSDIATSNTRELQTIALPVGKMAVQFIDQFGNPVKVGNNANGLLNIPLLDKGENVDNYNYIGQYIPLNSKYVIQNIPKNYMWALDNQVFTGAKSDKQSGGNTATTADDGDPITGQANVGIVPMRTAADDDPNHYDYIYKVYVYGTPQKVTYQYVDKDHPDRILTSPLSGKTGTEAEKGLVTANYGNTIDWDNNSYYTTDNVPVGYHYAKGYGLQPKPTVVSDNNPVVTLYVEGNDQSITPEYQEVDEKGNKTGTYLVPNIGSASNITGRTGSLVVVPDAPDVNNYALDHVEIDGKQISVGATFEMSSGGTEKVIYYYHSLDKEKNAALTDINQKAENKKKEIQNDSTLTQSQKDAQVQVVEDAVANAKKEIGDAKLPKEVDTAHTNAIEKIDAAHQPGDTVDKQKADAIDYLKQKAAEANSRIDESKVLTIDEKNSQQTEVGNKLTEATNAINSAEVTTAQQIADLRGKYEEIFNGYPKAVKSISERQQDALNDLLDTKNTVSSAIKNDATLTQKEKNDQLNAVEDDYNKGTAAIKAASSAQEVKDQFNKYDTAIKNDYIPGKDLSLQKQTAKEAVNNAATAANNQINGDKALTTNEKNKQLGQVSGYQDPALAAIDKATSADE